MAADKTNPDPATETPEPDPKAAEEAYWGTFETKLDAWFEKKKGELMAGRTSRTGRPTLPSVIADLFFGPEK